MFQLIGCDPNGRKEKDKVYTTKSLHNVDFPCGCPGGPESARRCWGKMRASKDGIGGASPLRVGPGGGGVASASGDHNGKITSRGHNVQPVSETFGPSKSHRTTCGRPQTALHLIRPEKYPKSLLYTRLLVLNIWQVLIYYPSQRWVLDKGPF